MSNHLPVNDVRILAALQLAREISPSSDPPKEGSAPYAAINERAGYETPDSLTDIVKETFNQEDGYTDRSLLNGYRLGYYISKSILPIPQEREKYMAHSTRRITAILSRRAARGCISPQSLLIGFVSEYDLPETPKGDAFISDTTTLTYPLAPVIRTIAKGSHPETRAHYGEARESAIALYMGGVGLAQMAIEESWYSQLKLIESKRDQQLEL